MFTAISSAVMNVAISGLVGATVAGALLVTGVNVAQGDSQTPAQVSDEVLYGYSSS